MYRLEQWKVVTIEDTRYESPELQRKVLAGRVYNNPHFKDGEKIYTSRPLVAKGRIIKTLSGSVYRLGEPDPEYLEWMKENYPNFDPENPIKI